MTWKRFTDAPPPIGPELLLRTQNPLSTIRAYRDGNTIYDECGNSICEVETASADLRGWLWAVLEEKA